MRPRLGMVPASVLVPVLALPTVEDVRHQFADALACSTCCPGRDRVCA